MTPGHQALPFSLDLQSEKDELRGSRLTPHLTLGRPRGWGGLHQLRWKQGEVGLNQCADEHTVARTGWVRTMAGMRGRLCTQVTIFISPEQS